MATTRAAPIGGKNDGSLDRYDFAVRVNTFNPKRQTATSTVSYLYSPFSRSREPFYFQEFYWEDETGASQTVSFVAVSRDSLRAESELTGQTSRRELCDAWWTLMDALDPILSLSGHLEKARDRMQELEPRTAALQQALDEVNAVLDAMGAASSSILNPVGESLVWPLPFAY